MASLTRVTKHGNRLKILAANGRVGMGPGAANSVRIEFGYACENIDSRYEYVVTLASPEIYQLMMQVRSGEIAGRLSPEEWATWAALSAKALDIRL